MAWMTVEGVPAGNTITFNTRYVSAVADPPTGETGTCWIQLIGDTDNVTIVKGTRETLIKRILAAERSERLERD